MTCVGSDRRHGHVFELELKQRARRFGDQRLGLEQVEAAAARVDRGHAVRRHQTLVAEQDRVDPALALQVAAADTGPVGRGRV